MTAFDYVRQGLVVIGGIGAIVFPIYYWLTAPGWRHNEMGRFIMLGGLGWMALYLSGIVAIIFPSEFAREVIRLVLIVSAGSFAWYQVYLYRKVRRQSLRERKEDNDGNQGRHDVRP